VTAPFETSHDMIVAARRNLDQDAWEYICGGAESETSLRRNRLALDSIAFRPRILRDVREIDTSATLLGHRMRIPVLLAPMGRVETFTPGGAADVDTAAEEFGTINAISTVTAPSLEDVAANSPHAKIFQIYVRGDGDWLADLMKRVVAAKYSGIALTVDLPYYGNRERISTEQLAVRRNHVRNFQQNLTWDTVKWLQDRIGDIPFMIKGIMTAEDAALAVENGVQVVWVSNHGGRQLDHTLGNIAMLPEIVAAVDGKAEIIIDGGFTRGTDVIKAIAMGADAVAIGKLQAWALGAAGTAGLVRCLELLEREIQTTMGLIGVTALDQLDPSCLTEAMPVRMAHEMSAFPHLPGGQIL
jgi:glycolate oxidase